MGASAASGAFQKLVGENSVADGAPREGAPAGDPSPMGGAGGEGVDGGAGAATSGNGADGATTPGTGADGDDGTGLGRGHDLTITVFRRFRDVRFVGGFRAHVPAASCFVMPDETAPACRSGPQPHTYGTSGRDVRP